MSEHPLSDDSSLSDNERSALIEQLLLTHIQQRLQGEDVVDDELTAQHPELMPELAERLQLFREMADLRAASETMESVVSASDTGMLSVRCPHCRELVRVPADTSFIDITCSSCGSSFCLADESAAQTLVATSARRLGHFELVEQLGFGSFGTVWKGRDTELDRFVAVKIPRRGQLDSQEIAQFLREARAAAQLNHPNIVSVHEVGRDGETVFIVSDLVRGVSLSDWLTQRQPTIRETCTLCATIANALQHAHEAGVIHRDLKPQNIIVDEEGEPHLMDFGLARRDAGEITMTVDGHVLGTPAYMSPEQARGQAHQADRRTDVYSLGVILFELLTGELPFRGNPRMILHQVLHDEAPSPRKLNSTIPKELETICLKCLEKEHAKRYGSAQDVADELHRFLRDEPIHARPIPATHRLLRWVRRKPVLAVLVLVLFGLAVAGPIVAVTQTRLRLAADRATARANQERLKADQQAYISDMNLAAQAWAAGDLTRTRELLGRYHPVASDPSSLAFPRSVDQRGFEWRLLWGLANDEQDKLTFEGGEITVTCVALSPEGTHLAWGGVDGTVTTIDMESDREKVPVGEHSSSISRLTYSCDGRWLAVGCDDGAIHLWEVGSWRQKVVLTGHTGRIRDLVFHPDGTHLTSIGTDTQIRIWDLADAGEAQVFDNPEPEAPDISISSDGTTLAIFGGLDNTVRFWQLPRDPQRGEYLKVHTLPPQKAIVKAVVLSTDGKTAIISSHDSLVSRWDIATSQPLVTYPQKVLAQHLALSADGQTLVTAGTDNLLKVWDVESGHERRTLRGISYEHETNALVSKTASSQLMLSADGSSLVSVGIDNTVSVWGISTGEQRNRLLHNGIIPYLAISPDGRTLAASDPNFLTVTLWDLATRKSIPFLERAKYQVAFSLDGKWFASLTFVGDGHLSLWDRSTIPYRMGSNAVVGSVAIGNHLTFSHDSKTLAMRYRGDTVGLWDVGKQDVMGTLPEHTSLYCATAFRMDDQVIATASDEQIRLWEVASQRRLAVIPDQHHDIRSLCFSPDGNLLAAASGNTELRWWDVRDPTAPRGLPPLRGHTSFITAVAFSPDGKTLATGSYDSTLRLWDVSLRQQVALLQDHSSVVNSIVWSPDGNTIFTGSGDASVRIWHAPSWKEIETAEARSSAAGQSP